MVLQAPCSNHLNQQNHNVIFLLLSAILYIGMICVVFLCVFCIDWNGTGMCRYLSGPVPIVTETSLSPSVGSTSSSMSDHWLVRLNGDSKRGSLVSRSSTTCPSSVPDSPESPVFLDDPPREEEGEGPGKHEMHGKPKKGKKKKLRSSFHWWWKGDGWCW